MRCLVTQDPAMPWLGIIRIRVRERLQYRFDFFMTFIATVIQAMVLFAVWRAVYEHWEHPPLGWQELFSYVAVAQAINLARWSPAERSTVYGSAGRVRSGDVALDLVRPLGFHAQRLCEALAFLVVELGMVTLPSLALFIFVYGVTLPTAPSAVAGFVVSFAFGFMVAFGLNSLIALAAFWTTNVHGVQIVRRAVSDILAGTLIPLEFLPHWVRWLADWLPFKATTYVPLSIYLGQINGAEMYRALGLQLVWAAALIGLVIALWARAMRRFTVFGG